MYAYLNVYSVYAILQKISMFLVIPPSKLKTKLVLNKPSMSLVYVHFRAMILFQKAILD